MKFILKWCDTSPCLKKVIRALHFQRQICLLILLSFILLSSNVFSQQKTARVKGSRAKVKTGECTSISVPPGLPTDRVIQSDIRYAIALGVHHMTGYFNSDLDDAPSFSAKSLANGDGEFDMPNPSGVTHVIGRGLLPIMLAEEVTEIPFPEKSLEIFEKYLKKAYDNPGNLNSYIDPTRNNRFYMAAHNQREGLYGLISLIKGRNREWAWEKARLMILKLAEITDSQGHFSSELAKKAGLEDRFEGIGGEDATNCGRLVEPLLEYHQLSGNITAFWLAGLYAKATLKSAFTESGEFKPFAQSGGHIHSLTSSLCGIAKYAVETNDRLMLEACVRIMDNGVRNHSTTWGWVDEVTDDHWADVRLRGEVNQTGDVVRTALVLGRAGYTRFYEVAERFVRNMLLQGQHNEEEMKRYMRDNPNPSNERERNVLSRNIGGYSMLLPNDRMGEGQWPLSTLDVTSGAVHALCEAWRQGAEINSSTIKVNLLFDLNNNDIELRSSLPLIGKLRFFKKSDKDLYVRIPSWVDTNTLLLEVQGKKMEYPIIEKGYLHVGILKKGDVGTILFDVPCLVKHEKVEDQDYRVTWWGDQVIDIDPPGKVSPFPFKPL